MTDKAKEEAAVTGPERPPDEGSLAQQIGGPAGWGPESSDPKGHGLAPEDEDDEDDEDE